MRDGNRLSRALRWNAAPVRSVLIFLFVFCAWVGWMLWGVRFLSDQMCPTDSACTKLGQIGDLFGGVNALFAGLAFAGLVISLDQSRRANAAERRWQHDKELAEQTRSSFEWAYNALANDGRPKEPKRNRMAWLSAARHLLRAERLAKRIQTEAFRLIHEEHEEYWRTEIYQLFTERLTGDFFIDMTEERPRALIDSGSAMVISRFLAADGWQDPLGEVDRHAIVERDGWGAPPLSRALESFILKVEPDFVDKHLQRYPKGRVATERANFVAMQKKRQDRAQQQQQQS